MAGHLRRGSLPLFAFKGIRVYLHWSFIALPLYIIATGLMDGESWPAVLERTGLVLVVFCCVILHEYGHALTALRFGVGTRDITLLPIGGVASLERMPEDPKQEFWITVAGPMVNLVIAGLAFVLIAVLGLTTMISDLLLGAGAWTSLLAFLFAANMGLFLFNLIPAFPMDGGRILRSLLAMGMAREKATRIASVIGRILAVCFIAYGLMEGQVFLALIGVFIFFAAGAEERSVAQRSLLKGVGVGEVMRTRFLRLPAHATVRRALDELLTGADTGIVIDRDPLPPATVGRRQLIEALEAGKQDTAIGDLVSVSFPLVRSTDDAGAVAQRMAAEGLALLPVVDDGLLVGVFELATLQEFLRIRKAAGAKGG